MRSISICGSLVVAMASTFWGIGMRSAVADELRVFSSGAAAAVLTRMAGQAGTGSRIVLTVARPAELQAKLAAGEKADVIVAPAVALDTLDKAGRLVSVGRLTVARVGIGVAVRRDAPRPDVSTVAALRAELLASPSIVHPDPAQAGSNAGKALSRMIAELGIAEAVRARLIYRQAIAGGVEMVAKGEAAIGLFIVSEILPIAGVVLAGPLPTELQSYITFDAAIIAGSSATPAAEAYVSMLASPGARVHWETAGLEQIGVRP